MIHDHRDNDAGDYDHPHDRHMIADHVLLVSPKHGSQNDDNDIINDDNNPHGFDYWMMLSIDN